MDISFLEPMERSAVLVGAIVGLAVAIIGALIQFITLKIELNALKNEANKARSFDLKRRVLLDSVEAINKTRDVIATLASTPLNDLNKKMSEINLSGAVARINLVCDFSTIKSLGSFSEQYVKSLLSLMIEKTKISEMTLDIESNKSSIERMIKIQEDVRGLIDKYLSIGNRDEAEIQHKRWLDLNNEIIKFYDSNISLHDKIGAEQIALTRKSIEALIELGPKLSKLLISARQELNMNIDIEEYTSFTQSMDLSAKETFSSFLKQVEELNSKP